MQKPIARPNSSSIKVKMGIKIKTVCRPARQNENECGSSAYHDSFQANMNMLLQSIDRLSLKPIATP